MPYLRPGDGGLFEEDDFVRGGSLTKDPGRRSSSCRGSADRTASQEAPHCTEVSVRGGTDDGALVLLELQHTALLLGSRTEGSRTEAPLLAILKKCHHRSFVCGCFSCLRLLHFPTNL